MAAQIELLANARVPGSKELLDAVEAKEKMLGEFQAVESAIQQQIKAIAEHEHDVWDEILHDLLYAGTSGWKTERLRPKQRSAQRSWPVSWA